MFGGDDGPDELEDREGEFDEIELAVLALVGRLRGAEKAFGQLASLLEGRHLMIRSEFAEIGAAGVEGRGVRGHHADEGGVDEILLDSVGEGGEKTGRVGAFAVGRPQDHVAAHRGESRPEAGDVGERGGRTVDPGVVDVVRVGQRSEVGRVDLREAEDPAVEQRVGEEIGKVPLVDGIGARIGFDIRAIGIRQSHEAMGGLDEIGRERGPLEIGGADHLLDEAGDCLDRDPDQFGDAGVASAQGHRGFSKRVGGVGIVDATGALFEKPRVAGVIVREDAFGEQGPNIAVSRIGEQRGVNASGLGVASAAKSFGLLEEGAALVGRCIQQLLAGDASQIGVGLAHPEDASIGIVDERMNLLGRQIEYLDLVGRVVGGAERPDREGGNPSEAAGVAVIGGRIGNHRFEHVATVAETEDGERFDEAEQVAFLDVACGDTVEKRVADLPAFERADAPFDIRLVRRWIGEEVVDNVGDGLCVIASGEPVGDNGRDLDGPERSGRSSISRSPRAECEGVRSQKGLHRRAVDVWQTGGSPRKNSPAWRVGRLDDAAATPSRREASY